jgi:uncharacterized membrane-anchored protein
MHQFRGSIAASRKSEVTAVGGCKKQPKDRGCSRRAGMTIEPSSSEFEHALGAVLGFPAHAARAEALGEVHARPHPLLELPRLLICLSFMTDASSTTDYAVLCDLSRRLGIAAPDARARHHSMPWGKGTLRWERHTEFSSYLWEGPLGEHALNDGSPFGNGFKAPGPVISGIRLELRPWSEREASAEGFDPTSFCHTIVEGGKAAVLTDFRQDGNGLTPILVLDRGLSPARAGVLTQRLIEIETYRTLAMLGLPLAQMLSARVRRMEERLAAITHEMRSAATRENRVLLAELTELAADLEADVASSLYRFGASRAYDEIVGERLEALDEEVVEGAETLRGFLKKRVAPAMRTCRSVEARQAHLSEKLTRATTLLRTWVDVEVEEQTRTVLSSMNDRVHLQLRLQQTVEGLSVAAVAYYVVGLIGYLVKATTAFGIHPAADVVTGFAVPVVVLCVWLLVRHIRRSHSERKSTPIGSALRS